MKPSLRAFLDGIQAQLPLLIGVLPFGMIYGALALNAGLSRAAAQGMSSIVFAGSAQFITTQLIRDAVPGLIIVLTIVVVNLRHMLYSASIAPYLRKLPMRWKALLAYLLTDEAYATVITHYEEQQTPFSHWYFLGAGLIMWLSWQVSTGIGVFLGTEIPAGWSLDFFIPLVFIALVMPTLKDQPSISAALSAGLVAVLAYTLPYKLGLVAAALVGILVGAWLEGRK
ncbi:MAG: AzlC family ABC transporter permease [Anaerolineales bacterium]|nr:AzlC family ABC transporter permease [Anaerolineales bacterium]